MHVRQPETDHQGGTARSQGRQDLPRVRRGDPIIRAARCEILLRRVPGPGQVCRHEGKPAEKIMQAMWCDIPGCRCHAKLLLNPMCQPCQDHRSPAPLRLVWSGFQASKREGPLLLHVMCQQGKSTCTRVPCCRSPHRCALRCPAAVKGDAATAGGKSRGGGGRAWGALTMSQAPPEGFCLICEQSGGMVVSGCGNPDRDRPQNLCRGSFPCRGRAVEMTDALGGTSALAIMAGGGCVCPERKLKTVRPVSRQVSTPRLPVCHRQRLWKADHRE